MKPQLITALGRQRMEQMIAYLRMLNPKAFYFGQVKCGSTACAIGHTPNIWPDLCKYDTSVYSGSPFSVNGQSYTKVAEDLFGIDGEIANLLFTPLEDLIGDPNDDDSDLEQFQNLIPVDGLHLNGCTREASPTEVADQLQSFLDQVDDRP